MKKFLYIVFLIFLFAVQTANAEEVFKITSVNFDTSSSMMVLTSPDGTASPIVGRLKLIKMQNPNRVYFDINSAIITAPKEDISFSTGVLRHAIVAQNSTNPAIVRVVLTFNESFNVNKVNVFRFKNNIFVKFNDEICKNENYFQNTYREEKTSEADYYEYSVMTSQVITKVEKPVAVAQSPNIPSGALKEIQAAFVTSNIPKEIETAFSDVTVSQVKKDLKLNTRYYLNNIVKTSNGLLLSGFGAISVEKPILLSGPARVVYDLPNTFASKELRNKEYFINETETIKIGQFETNKARLVIKTTKPDKYLPIYSPDNETLLIADREKLNIDSLFNIRANLMATFHSKEKEGEEVILAFSAPIVYSIEKTSGEIVLTLYNIDKYNESNFVNALKGTSVSDIKIEPDGKLLKVKYKISEKGSVRVFSGVDGKSLKLFINEPQENRGIMQLFTKKSSSQKVIVIDPGHGGIDGGAVRAGITEKSITLDVSQRVAAILNSKGFVVHLTRSDDCTLSLQERVDIAEAKGEDVFISVHVNASEKTDIIGIETHYYHDYSKNLARVIHDSMSSAIKTTNRGLFKSKFYVINHTTKPAILVEIGFLSNANERQQLLTDERKQATAEAIAQGVENYFKEYK